MLKVYPLIVLLAVALAGCSGSSSPEQLIESARGSMAKQEYKSALIQLKNALQKQPSSQEARLLLAQTLAKLDDPQGAIAEFDKALQLGASAEQVSPEIARALLEQGLPQQVVTRFRGKVLETPQGRADLAASMALAYMNLGKQKEAQEQVSLSLKDDPQSATARVVQARILAAQHDVQAATALVDAVVADTPTNVDAWLLKGQLVLNQAQPDGTTALKSFNKAIEINPRSVAAQSAALWFHLGNKDLTAAAERLQALKSARPSHPGTLFFSAVLALEKNDLRSARETAQALLKVAADDPKALHVAGAIEYRRGSLLQAQAFLNKALAGAPQIAPTRLLLAQTYIRSGDSNKALSTLQPLLTGTSPSGDAFRLAAEGLMQQGKFDQAETFYRKASELNPNDAKNKTALALAKLARGESERGFAELRSIASHDDSSVADMALIAAYMRRSEHSKALEAIGNLEKKAPNTVMPPYLRGMVRQSMNDLKAARSDLEAALKIDPVYLPAIVALSNWDVQSKNHTKAIERYQQLLTRDENNLTAQMAIAAIKADTGASYAEVAELLGKAVRTNPAEVTPRLALIDLHVGKNDLKLALSTAQSAAAAVPDQAEVLAALGNVQGLSGDFNQAMGTFGRLAALQPNSPKPFMLMADLQMRSKDVVGAGSSLRRALALQSDYEPAQRGLAMLELMSGRYAEAKAIAKTMQGQRSSGSGGQLLEGDIELGRGNFDAAAVAYRAGMSKAPSTELVIKLHRTLSATRKNEERRRLESQWLGGNPKDAEFRFYLGDQALAEKDYARAENFYRAVLQLLPESPAAMNNLAWALLELKKPGALELADRAVKLRPKDPSFWDTLAKARAKEGLKDKAVEAAKTASDLAPNSASLRLAYAKQLLAADQKKQAKPELTKLASLDGKSAEQDEAKRLLSDL